MAIQSQYILVKKANGDVGITQNSVEVFSSINASAIVNTLVLKEGMVGVGLVSPTTKLHIQVANTINKQALLIEQLDTTNNPICAEINNDGTNHGLYIHQDGVLAASKYALYIYSNTALSASGLLCIQSENASSYGRLVTINNVGGLPTALFIDQIGTNLSTGHGLHVKKTGSHNSNPDTSLVKFEDTVGSPEPILLIQRISGNGFCTEIDNDGTGTALYIHQDGKLADSKHALYIYNNTNQNVSNLVKIEQASSADCQTVVSIINAQGWGSCVTISQTGVLQATSNALLVGSNAVQVNEYLLHFWQNNASSTAGVQKITNNGSGTGLLITQNGNGSALVITNVGTKNGIWIDQQGAIGAGYPALKVYSNTAQVNDSFVQFYLNHASSTRNVLELSDKGTGGALIIQQVGNGTAQEIYNAGTNHGLYIHQDGVLVGGLHALYVTSSAAQINSSLVRFYQQSGSSTTNTLLVHNGGKGNGLYIQQDVVLDTNRCSLYVYTDVAQINSSLVLFRLNNASATGTVLEITNAGTGHGIYIHQDGVLASNKMALCVYSNAVQVNENLVQFTQNNTASNRLVLCILNQGEGQTCYINSMTTGIACEIDNNGTNHGLYIHQDGVLASSKYGLYVYSNAIQTNGCLVNIVDNNSASTHIVTFLQNEGTGSCLKILQNGILAGGQYSCFIYSSALQANAALLVVKLDNASATAQVVGFTNEGTGHNLYLQQDGNLASGKFVLTIDNNGTPADGAGRCIRLDGCTITSTKNPETDSEAGFIGVNIDGTQFAVPYYALS